MATIEVNPSMYFECPVCMEEIDDTWKMLPCQHVFCHSCLRNIYEAGRNQNLRCPTCRQVIAVPLEQLQKPRLLYEFHENLKASQNRATVSSLNDVDEDLIAAIKLQSIDVERKRQEETDNENEHLQIALCKSADEAVLRAEMESLLCAEEKDLIAAIELSIRENKRPAMEMPKKEAGKETTRASSNNDKTESNTPFYFSLSNFNNHLKSNGNLILDTMLRIIGDNETLNSLESSEVVLYLKAIDRYLNTLKCFRKNQIARIIQDFGEHRGKYKHNSASGNRDSRADSDKDDNVLFTNEDDDLTSLIGVLEVEKNEDAILKIVLKKSEVLDPIDRLCNQFLEIRKKLDRVFSNVVNKPTSYKCIRKVMEAKYIPSLLFSPVEYLPSSSPQPHQAPSFPLPPTSSLILPLPTAASRRPVQTTNHSLILPLAPHPNPSVSNSRGNVRASSVRGGYRGRGGNYRGNRGNERGYRGNHCNIYENHVDYANHCENRGGFYRGRGENSGNRGAHDVTNGGYKGRYFHRRH